ncbi:MAG: tRNA pseudouridine55 synthase [Parcubacteria group bacterium Gr01-1014_18]|nr:MAG: tRNA pseudouridine55 synthase [Parcubacteria group bacterium Greene0416_36]TSC81438.1 MAG: tRNA pseudouridine55 synthase [Parcubacteria group bacterium Gr01-1014_18]TSC99036.1 MAG: tRNA pseudouridine55 synthase [Parcubacteria group bacterium Greene1014_20]TSD07283.1 MAG: tRNA pseudouridine55 synthase [Parcubacteria group bacterium Greene0714_2]
MPSGFLFIHKPSGPTSYGVIHAIKKITGTKKIGHAGTLDPLAEGLLIVGVGREATKHLGDFLASDKEYIASIIFGGVSNTYDAEGIVVPTQPLPQPLSKTQLEETLKTFLGAQQQMPPIFSAKKIKGQKAYDLARQNKPVELAPVGIEIKELELLSYTWPIAQLRIRCSSGTYIRSIAHDLGQKLGAGAYLSGLIRTETKGIRLDQAVKIADLNTENWTQYLIPPR